MRCSLFLLKNGVARSATSEVRGIWQRHYWEHLIRDEQDYRRHMDYVHINPLKHGHVTRVADWPYSTFHRYVASGVYPPDWCGSVDGASRRLE
ncbi:REP-associated tyrosine transposase [Aeromonas hydrophila]|uniref:REP-associated tyrosine transposase n=1 Tax=Aeromonas hydrophila TaxID=644 RepID=UPI004057EBCB